MKTKTSKLLIFLLVLLMATSLVACNTSTDQEEKVTSAPKSTVEAEKTEETKETVTEETAINDPLGKYDPPITISIVKVLDDTVKFLEGEDIEHNVWADAYRDILGITLEYEWTASTSQQYDDKLNVNIASGMIPDMLEVNKSQFARLAKAELINTDISAEYEEYGSELLKEIMAIEGPDALESAEYKGNLAALPETESSMATGPLMYIRQDWLETVGKSAPTTIDELLSLIDDFTTLDPDKSGATDYYGIAMQKNLYGGLAGIEGFCNAFHAYPQAWIEDASGRLVYGSYQPEMKDALLALQKLYMAGKIDSEFAVKDDAKESELLTSGKIGIEFGQFWNPVYPLKSNLETNPSADWFAYLLPSVDSEPAKTQVKLGVSSYFVCSKDCEYPEAMVKMDNLFVEMGYGSDPANFSKYLNANIDDTTYELFKYAFVITWPGGGFNDVPNALKNNDPSGLNEEFRVTYESIKEYEAGGQTGWAASRIFGYDGSYYLLGQCLDSGNYMMDAFFGSDTDTMTTKKAALDKLELEAFTKIIMGDSIDEFDAFVEQAMELGGSDIEQEVNDWNNSK